MGLAETCGTLIRSLRAANIDSALRIERRPGGMGKHFDELSKALANGVSRRSALKRFAAGVAGAPLASVPPGRKTGAQNEGGGRKDICGELGLHKGAHAQCGSEYAARPR